MSAGCSLTWLTNVPFRSWLASLLGASLLGRCVAQLLQFRLHRLVLRLIDEHVHGGPADPGIGAIHQAAQLLFTCLGGHQALCDVLTTQKLELRRCNEGVDTERCRAAPENRHQQRSCSKLDPHPPLVSFTARSNRTGGFNVALWLIPGKSCSLKRSPVSNATLIRRQRAKQQRSRIALLGTPCKVAPAFAGAVVIYGARPG